VVIYGSAKLEGVLSMQERSTERVVIFIFTDGDKILTEKRSSQSFLEPRYLIPGGLVETDEDLEQALKREIKEELGVTALDFIPLPSPQIRGLNNQLLLPFIINRWEGRLPNFILDQGNPLEWLEMDQVLETAVESTRKIVEALKSYLSKS